MNRMERSLRMIRLYDISPAPAPRQSRRDAWKPSPEVKQYRAFRDEVAYKIKSLPTDYFHVVFFIPMPKSWAKKRQSQTLGMKHTQKPDKDNLEKALIDAFYRHADDAHVWNTSSTKVWAWRGAILISDHYLDIRDPGILKPVIDGTVLTPLTNP